MIALRRTSFDTTCRVEVEHSDTALCAHVELAGDVAMEPGDRVHVHGAPITVGFGERRVLERRATVQRAGLFERVWTRISANFEITELYEVSFSERTRP